MRVGLDTRLPFGSRKGATALKVGGFPCRFPGCDIRYPVSDQGSLPALLAVSALRSEHEVSAHGYHHVRAEEPQRKQLPFLGSSPKTPPRLGA